MKTFSISFLVLDHLGRIDKIESITSLLSLIYIYMLGGELNVSTQM
jgi:hypothetical protein